MSLLPNSNAIETGGYTIQRSLRFRSSASAYLNRTPASAGSQRTWTWSFWVKRGTMSTGDMIPFSMFQSGGGALVFLINSSDTLDFYQYYYGYQFRFVTNQVFRDPSAWYHFVVAVDTTQATDTNRIKLYVNGTQITSFSTASYPSQNSDLLFNMAQSHAIGQYASNNTAYYDGYMAEINFINAQQLTPSSFGQTDATTGVWVPKKYGGTYGTNGFYLPFTDTTSATTLAYDASGNGNNWTPNNISTTAGVTYDSMTDVPTNTSASTANYAVWNPLKTSNVGSPSTTTQNGNLTTTSPTAYGTFATMAVSSGKWYWEYTITTGSSWTFVGVVDSSIKLELDRGAVGGYATAYYANGWKGVNGTFSAYGSSFTTNDIIGVALDCDANTVQFYKNNVAQGSISLPTSAGTLITAFACDENNAGSVVNVNFGQRPFSYSAPSGYKQLNTFNLPDPTIKKPNQYMDATLYTGTGTTTNNITTLGFQPDFVWIKDRQTAYDNQLFDSVRGAANSLYSNATNAENAYSTSLASFNSNGFTITNTGNNQYYLNKSGDAFVSWNWKAGGTPATTNTSGSIVSTVSVNPTAGFSVATYTGNGVAGATVGHGLGVSPAMIVVKSRNAAQYWIVWHQSLPAITYNMYFNTNDSQQNDSQFTAKSSTTVTLNNASVVTNGNTYVMYCWAEIAGYSKFGSYTGNGDSDGPFVFLGFRPRYILAKPTDSSNGWFVWDTARDTYNVATKTLSPNSTDTEQSAWYNNIDVLSNGFKVRSYGYMNGGGVSYIYAAFAENPFKYANAR